MINRPAMSIQSKVGMPPLPLRSLKKKSARACYARNVEKVVNQRVVLTGHPKLIMCVRTSRPLLHQPMLNSFASMCHRWWRLPSFACNKRCQNMFDTLFGKLADASSWWGQLIFGTAYSSWKWFIYLHQKNTSNDWSHSPRPAQFPIQVLGRRVL